ncbi:MAG: SRPBCC domain-containing protein [Phycisphaerales bacterium]
MSNDLMTECPLDVKQSIDIDAPIEIAFDALLEQLGPANVHPDGYSMKLVLEARPGGRWFRDLGDNNGHLWGHVQVIKRPALLEICGPLFMSYPALSHVQFRLAEERGRTTVSVQHRAIGPVEAAHREGVGRGWKGMLEGARGIAAKRTTP